MCVTVLVPITFPGSLISTRGSRAARANRASAEIPSPGAMTPPRYSPFAEITSNVIAGPKSTTMHGPPDCDGSDGVSSIRRGVHWGWVLEGDYGCRSIGKRWIARWRYWGMVWD